MTEIADAGRRLTRISPSLWWYRDTCNVFLWTAGELGLLVDFGSGAILDELEGIGVREVVAVAHTHHHRDQCGGDDRAAAMGIPIWVPARERALFESTEAFWRMRRTYDSYDASSLGFTRASSVPVSHGLLDHERITWAGGELEIVPTPGHTKGSISLLAEVDGTSVAFTGDLIAAPGRVPTLHDLQWQYGMPDAVGAARHSVVSLADRGPQRLLPSHGLPMDDGPSALAELAGNLRQLSRLLSEIRRNRVWTTWPSSVDQPIAHPLPHLWFNGLSVANTYALVDDAGEALILDYGFPSWDHFFADQRFVAHTLDTFRSEAGLKGVKAAIPSHYHDDHLAGVPWLQREHGAQAWIHQSFAEIAATPERYDLPCHRPEPIRVDRVLADGDLVEHAGARLEAFHMPGHTMFALGLGGTLDGVRVAYTGDNLLAGSMSPLRAAAPIYRNVMRHDSIRVGVKRLITYEPELLLTGHTGTLEVTRADFDEFIAWARELELVMDRLCPIPGLPDEALDPYPAWFDPYRASASPGATVATTVIVRNHAKTPRDATVQVVAPAGWTVAPRSVVATVPADGGTAKMPVTITVPADATAGRVVITVDLELGAEPRGQVAETLIEVLAR